jgi:hypothetical protein
MVSEPTDGFAYATPVPRWNMSIEWPQNLYAPEQLVNERAANSERERTCHAQIDRNDHIWPWFSHSCSFGVKFAV